MTLFIPEKWFSEDYALRRGKCRLTSDISFKTKPQLAVEMLEKIVDEGKIPFRYVVADSIYGNSVITDLIPVQLQRDKREPKAPVH